MHSYKKTFLGGGLLSLTVLSGAVLSAPKANADTSATIDLTVNVPAACSLTPANTSLTKTINPGTSETIGTANLKAVCNDPNGFAIYAVGYTNEEYGNNYLTTTLGEDYKIATGNVASPSTSQWNMTIGIDSTIANNHVATIENQFEEAHEVPETYTKIASLNSTTDQSIGANLTSTFNAYIAPNQAAGTYEGKVKFMLVHPSTEAPDTTPLGLAYASRNKTKVNGFYSMQDMSSDICGALSIGDEGSLIDTRDNTVYPIAKLADGKCWMTKNLGLNLSQANITKENTNNPSEALMAAIDSKTIPEPNTESWCSSDISDCQDRVNYNPPYYNWYTATAGHGLTSLNNSTPVSGDICPSGWRLPTSDYYLNQPNNEYGQLASVLVGHLPESGYSSYSDSEGIAVSILLREQPNNFSFDGYYVYGRIEQSGTTGAYWTSSAYGASRALSLWFTSNYVQPGTGFYSMKYYGIPMRCLAE